MIKKLHAFAIFCVCLLPGGFSQSLTASLYFETNQAVLSDSEILKLKTFAGRLDTVNVLSLHLNAYCDDRGSTQYNIQLASKRALAVKQALESLGTRVAVDAQGKGELPLTNRNDSMTERSQNRRADLTATYSLRHKPLVKEEPKEIVAEQAPEKTKVAERKAPILSDDQKVGDKVTLENILFIGGRHVLLPESYESLENLKNLLLEKKKYHIMILGHICCISSGEDGMDFDTGKQNLSVARARAVYNYLVENGISADRLSYKGMRAKYPTGKSDREDRRVEIEITKVVEE